MEINGNILNAPRPEMVDRTDDIINNALKSQMQQNEKMLKISVLERMDPSVGNNLDIKA
jgi:hypothetical protein